MSAADLVAEVVAQVQAAGIPATSDAGVFPALLSRSGVAVLVDLPQIETTPVSGAGVRLTIPVRVVSVPGDPNGITPLLDAVELLGPALGNRQAITPEPFNVTPDTTAPAYTITCFRKD